MVDSLLHIGGTPIEVKLDTEGMQVLAEALSEVASCSPHPDVCIRALEVFQTLGPVPQVTIQDCTFTTAEALKGDEG